MSILRMEQFTGLDLRPGDHPPGALEVGLNVILDSRRSAIRRPGLVQVATLPAGTAGLYTMDDTVRCVAPNGTDPAGLLPAVLLDYVDVGTISGRVAAVRLASGRRAVWIEVSDGVPKLHLTEADPATVVTGSAVALDWTPRDLVGVGGRLFSLDRESQKLLWSGADDPLMNDGKGYVGDWSPALDTDQEAQKGGFVRLYQGGSGPVALAEYRNRVVVLSRAAVQMFGLDEGGISNLEQTIAGPGCRHLGVTGAMSGDLLYADAAGVVRRLSQDAAGLATEEGALGEPVASLTRNLAAPGATPYAIYARSLGCYLLAQGSTVACLAMLAGEVLGWSTWELPVPVEGLTECRGQVYVRSGNGVYVLADNAANDLTSLGIPVTVRPVVPVGRALTTVQAVGTSVRGAGSLMGLVVDGVPVTAVEIAARSPAWSSRWLTRRGRNLTPVISHPNAPADWRCDGLYLDAETTP